MIRRELLLVLIESWALRGLECTHKSELKSESLKVLQLGAIRHLKVDGFLIHSLLGSCLLSLEPPLVSDSEAEVMGPCSEEAWGVHCPVLPAEHEVGVNEAWWDPGN